MNGNVELLAPAGGPEAGYAALQYGADAAYLGLPRFSARAEAVNFDRASLADFLGYAHHLGRRAYATVNTLVKQRELPELIATLAVLAEEGIDGVIVQDAGVLRIARRHFPELRLHASTQLAVHNADGVRFLAELGVRRVTLARELSLPEIRDITAVAVACGIETEAFLHGALCYAYSGLCMFSTMQKDGRSANRGRCAYPCRDDFTRIPDSPADTDAQERGHIFSLKDLALAPILTELVATGVHSLKIEGRKKSPLYVAAVVNLYRSLLDRAGDDPDYAANCAQVQTIFSRPWTTYFAGGADRSAQTDTEIVGHRGARAGTVERVRERRLAFTTSLALERHDGLQLDLPGESRPYGFGIDELFVVENGRPTRAFAAPAGASVEVMLPPQAPFLPPGAAIYRSSSQELKRELQIFQPKPGEYRKRMPVRVRATLSAGTITAQAELAAADAGLPADWSVIGAEASLAGEFAGARDVAAIASAAADSFGKTGDTSFTLAALAWENPEARFIPVSRLNALRRDLYDALARGVEEARERRLGAIKDEVCVSVPAVARTDAPGAGGLRWSVKAGHPAWLSGLADAEILALSEVVIELDAQPDAEFSAGLERLTALIGRDRVRLSLPPVCRSHETEAITCLADRFYGEGYRAWQVANVWGLQLIRAAAAAHGAAPSITADWPLYTLNTQALRQWGELGVAGFCCSPEDEGANLRDLLAAAPDAAALTLIAYLDTPLFIGEACARSALTGCRGDHQECAATPLRIHDSFGAEYTLLSRGCRTYLLSNTAYCLSTRLPELAAAGLRSARADFLYRCYQPAELAAILRLLQAAQPVPQTREGNYARALQ